eukprot:gene14179-biopygen11304
MTEPGATADRGAAAAGRRQRGPLLGPRGHRAGWDVLEETGPHRTRSPPSDHHIAQGQRVRAYAIHGQAAAGGAWEVLATGASVGNKAIVLLPGDQIGGDFLRASAPGQICNAETSEWRGSEGMFR